MADIDVEQDEVTGEHRRGPEGHRARRPRPAENAIGIVGAANTLLSAADERLHRLQDHGQSSRSSMPIVTVRL
jgi:hypothetical protein